MLPKKGKRLHTWEGALEGREAYAETIAGLLRKEHGDSHRAAKQLMRQTGASERTVKHWLAANHGPDNIYLLRLLVTSPVIRAFILGVMEIGIRDRLSVEAERKFDSSNGDNGRSELTRRSHTAENDLTNVPINDPKSDLRTNPLNARQQWFLDRVASGAGAKANDIVRQWGVSAKTARRDIAVLRSAGLLQFKGGRRNGHYRAI